MKLVVVTETRLCRREEHMVVLWEDVGYRWHASLGFVVGVYAGDLGLDLPSHPPYPRLDGCPYRQPQRELLASSPPAIAPPPPLCDVLLPTLTRLGLRRLAPLVEAPTWVSPQGFIGALDHIFIQSPAGATHTMVVRSASGFLYDQLPVTSTIHCLPPSPQPIYPFCCGRYATPSKPLSSQLRALNCTFQEQMLLCLPAPQPGS